MARRPAPIFAHLRAWGLGERTIKTALAAALAWEAATYIPGGDTRPYFAPLAAILVVQITLAETISRALQRIVGVVAGVTVALTASSILGVSAWSIGLIVLCALASGARLRLGPQGTPQVAISALLVMVAGASPHGADVYGLTRIVETVVGAAIGIGVNALLVPPSLVPEAGEAVGAVAKGLAHMLDGLAASLSSGLTLEQAGDALRQARALPALQARALQALDQADESMRYNLFGADGRVRLTRYRRIAQTLEHTMSVARGMARTLNDLYAPGPEASPAWLKPHLLGGAFGQAISAAGQVVAGIADVVSSPGADASHPATARAEAVRQHRYLVARAGAQVAGALMDDWPRMGALLTDVERMLDALAGVAAAPVGEPGEHAGGVVSSGRV